MRAFAFLAAGSTTYLTGAGWPPPGEWLEQAASVRVCSADELAWWLDEELWEVELAGDIQPLGRALTAERARLVRRVERWDDEVADELVTVCARRVRDEAARALTAAGRPDDAALLEAADSQAEIEAAAARIAGSGAAGGTIPGLAADVVLYARDAGRPARAAGVAAYVAAFALAGGDRAAPGYQERFDAERRWQAGWLKERLLL